MKKSFGRVLWTTAFVVSLSAFGLSQSITLSSPSNGGSSTSPVHVVASANGGSSPVSAMRLYVDNQPVTTIAASQMNTYANVGAGSHYFVVVGWNTTGASFTSSATVNVSGAGSTTPAAPSGGAGVSISSPTAAATGSPIHFVASATPTSGRSITAMAVYLDNQLAYKANASSVDTYLQAGAGSHYAVVQSWDNTGLVTKSSVNVTVSGSSSGGSSASGSGGSSSGSTGSNPTPPSNPDSGPFANDLHLTSNWMATQVAPSGALLYTAQQINPYYANLAATGMVHDPARYVQIENWMRWYVSHLNKTDRWGLGGTMYDYNVSNGSEVSTGNADSTDSYAATFLSLAYAYYATGNAAAQSYVRSIAGNLDQVAQVLAKTQQSDGLTWAKPDYQIKYLMDNAEVFRGLADVSTLFGSIGDSAKQSYYGSLATKCQNGIWGMWLGSDWAVYKDGIGRLAAPNMGTWYPDATAQIYPVLYGVVPRSDTRAQQSYGKLNQAWPAWPQLSFNGQDPFPWVIVAGGAAQMGDTSRVNAYANSARAKWVDKGFPWTWYNMEGGWYMRVANAMDGGSF